MEYFICLAVLVVVVLFVYKRSIALWYEQTKAKAYYDVKGFKFSIRDWYSTKLSLFKIFHIIVSNFLKKEITLRAASLTYFTFTSIMPVMALIHLLLGYFRKDSEDSVSSILKYISDNEVLNKLNDLSSNYLTAQVTELDEKVLISIIVLFGLSFWGMLRMVMTIEGCANQLWEHKDRPLSNQIFNTVIYYIIAIVLFLATSYGGVYFLYSALAVILFCIIKYSPHQEVKCKHAIIGTAVSFSGILILGSDLVRNLIVELYSTYDIMGPLVVLLVSLDIFWIILLTGICISFVAEKEAKIYMSKECKEIAPAYETFLTIYTATLYYKDDQPDFDEIDRSLSDLKLPNMLLNKITQRLSRLGYLDMENKKLGKKDPTVGDLMYDINFSGSFNMKYNFTELGYWNEEYKKKVTQLFANLKTKLKDVEFGKIEALKEMTPEEAKAEDEAEHSKLNELYETLKTNMPIPVEPVSPDSKSKKEILLEKISKGLRRIFSVFR